MCASVYIQQEVYVEMFHAAVEGIEVFHPIPGSSESAWMCDAQNSSIQHVMYVEVLITQSHQTLEKAQQKHADFEGNEKEVLRLDQCD